jgi:tetratricopeptide (TPR) repeat protein
VGAGAFMVYLVTLCHWISLNSLGTVARIAGGQWRPELGRPLTLVVFAPLRLLPEAWLPLALNLVTAAVAALVLVQLARSVAILRHDVVSPDPMRKRTSNLKRLTGPHAWLPPVLAALGCGLQLGFWEHATSASGEMLSLLCFATAWRCLLEFRLAPQPRWLFRAAGIYALGLTDHWAMVGCLPVFVAGIIWAHGYGQCLNPRFLLRLALWTALGLSCYLVVPALLVSTAPESYAFWAVLKAQASAQKHALLAFRTQAARLLVVAAALPFLLLAVRWRSHTVQLADDTGIGVWLTRASGHFIHLLFFLAALWMTLDPALAPRSLMARLPLLYHYTWAMVVGYGAGYLLIFAIPTGTRRAANWPGLVLRGLAILLPAVLVWKNLGDVRLTNGSALREFARQLGDDLPPGPLTVLSDDFVPLFLLRAEQAARGGRKDLLVETRSLPWPEYHHCLARAHGTRWPEAGVTNLGAILDPEALRACIRRSATNETVVYLHPSSGLLLEDFTAVPHGWAQRLVERSQETAAPLDSAAAPWERRWAADLAARTAQFERQRRHAARWAVPALRLSARANDTAVLLAGTYAKALNHWGVQLRRAHHETEAGEWFRRAVTLDPDSLAARINLEHVTRQLAGDTNQITLKWLRDTCPHLLDRFENWADVISLNGPVDEPTFLFHTGQMYLAGKNPRQALEAFARGAALSPTWLSPRLWQAQTQNLLGNNAAALALTEDWGVAETQLEEPGLEQLLRARAVALWFTGRTNEAATFIEQFTTRHADATEVVSTAADLCAGTRQVKAELRWRELLQQRAPNRPDWLMKLGSAELHAGRFDDAIATFTRGLTLSPTNDQTRLLRAIASVRAGRLADARQDYEQLLPRPELAQSARFGLGHIAWRTRDTNAVIQNYQAFLSNSAATGPLAQVASQRLQECTTRAAE